MALVDSDLFLIQDAVTKANYKLSFENLTREIALDIDLDTVYVEVDGDNMTGDLTLGPVGTPTITLAATLGNGTFSGTLFAEYAQISERINGSNGLFIYGDVSSPTGIELEADGDIVIGGKLTVQGDANFDNAYANFFIGDGSQLTNLPVAAGLWEQNGNNLSPIAANSDLTGITDITIAGNFVATGTIEGESIDGGTYT
jgi:hypothetical protein